MTINFEGLGKDQTTETFNFNMNTSSDGVYEWNYTDTKDFDSEFVKEDISVDDMIILNSETNLETAKDKLSNIYTKLQTVNSEHMENIGTDINLKTYYFGALLPLAAHYALVNQMNGIFVYIPCMSSLSFASSLYTSTIY